MVSVLELQRVEKEEYQSLSEFLPTTKLVALPEILSFVDNSVDYLDCFTHIKIKYNKKIIPKRTFIAGIIGYGFNIGVKKISQITTNIKDSELNTALKWYFSVEKIRETNDKVTEFTGKLELTKLFQKNRNELLTSSDGQ